MKMYNLPGVHQDMKMTYTDFNLPTSKNIDLQETVIPSAPELPHTPSKGNTNKSSLKWILFGGVCAISFIVIFNEFEKNKNYTSNRRRRILSYY